MNFIKALFGLLLIGSVAAAIFFGIQYSRTDAQKDELALQVQTLENQLGELQKKNNLLDSLYRETVKRNDKLAGEKTDLQNTLRKVVEDATLDKRIEELEREIARLATPPVSPDASTPWEKTVHGFELVRTGKYGEYWELLNADFKQICPKENFVKLLIRLKPEPSIEPVFVDQATGETHAIVWFSANGRIFVQQFLLENGEWFMYGGNRGC